MSAWPEDSCNSKAQWAIGAVLYVTAAVGLVFWLMVLWTISQEPGNATFSVGTFTGSGLRDALLATPTVVALVATQATFGVGLMRRRPWVRWFGMAYVLTGMLTGVLSPSIPPNSWMSLVLPLMAAAPSGILLWRSKRNFLSERSSEGVLS